MSLSFVDNPTIRKKKLAFLISLLCISLPVKVLAEPLCKNVGKQWEWFGDHVSSSIEYVVAFNIIDSSKIAVGTGLFLADEPRGDIVDLTKAAKIKAYGIGSIHIRNKSDGSVKVCITSKNITAINFYSNNF
jgi:hypothetical protein